MSEKLHATIYRKGDRQCIFVCCEGTDKVKGVLSRGKCRVARFVEWTWKQAIAHEERLLKNGWEAVE